MGNRYQGGGGGSCAGFTMLELMLAAVVILIGILGLSGAVAMSNQNLTSSRERLRVEAALASQLEKIGETVFPQIASTYNGYRFDVPAVTIPNAGTSLQSTVTGEVKVVVLDPRRIAVTLTGTWTEACGPQTVTLYQEFAQ